MAMTVYTSVNEGILTNQPVNNNFLSPLGFRFTLKRSPNVNFFCTDANIPSFNLGKAVQLTPFVNVPWPGDKPEYGSFRLTFKIDEDMVNYLEILNWMEGLGFPDNFNQYQRLQSAAMSSGAKIVSDGNLTILNSAQNPNVDVSFKDLFPINLSDVFFTTADTTVNYVTATVEFGYTSFTMTKL